MNIGTQSASTQATVMVSLQQLNRAHDSMLQAYEVVDALNAIVHGFATNDEPRLSPSAVSNLIKCCQTQLSLSLAKISDAIPQSQTHADE